MAAIPVELQQAWHVLVYKKGGALAGMLGHSPKGLRIEIALRFMRREKCVQELQVKVRSLTLHRHVPWTRKAKDSQFTF